MGDIYPLVINWKHNLSETYEFRTDIFTSRNGSERRRAIRDTARRVLRFTSLGDKERGEIGFNFITENKGRLTNCPDYLREVYVAAVDLGAVTVEVLGDFPDWITVGSKIALRSNRYVELLTVESIAENIINLEESVTRAHAHNAKLHPVLSGRLIGASEFTLYTDSIYDTQFNFQVDPGSETYALETFDIANSYLAGREVFTLRPDWQSSPSITDQNVLETVDYGVGVIRGYVVTSDVRQISNNYKAKSLSESETLRNMFLRYRGACGEFYVPSPLKNGRLLSHDVDNKEIVLSGREIYDTYKDDVRHKAIEFYDNRDQYFRYTISSYSLDESENTVLTVTESYFELDVSAIESINWLYLVRFTSDEINLDWVTTHLCKTSFNFTVLPYNAAESDALEEFDEGAKWLLQTIGWTALSNSFILPLHYSANVQSYLLTHGVLP